MLFNVKGMKTTIPKRVLMVELILNQCSIYLTSFGTMYVDNNYFIAFFLWLIQH